MMWSTVNDQVEELDWEEFISKYKDLEKMRIPSSIDSLFCREIEMSKGLLKKKHLYMKSDQLN